MLFCCLFQITQRYLKGGYKSYHRFDEYGNKKIFMKKYSWLIIFCIITFIACRKDISSANFNQPVPVLSSSVPGSVIGSFLNTFNSTAEVEWFEDDHNFITQFNMDSQRHQSKFDDEGNEIEHTVICIDAPVPPAILQVFRKSYSELVSEWKLTNGGDWKAHFLRKGTKIEVTISSTGSILKEEHD